MIYTGKSTTFRCKADKNIKQNIDKRCYKEIASITRTHGHVVSSKNGFDREKLAFCNQEAIDDITSWKT